jgi:hypothetical protein
MLVLILDPKTARDGAAEGIELCIRSVIPSLFPFIFLGGWLAGGLSGVRLPLLERLLGIPGGSGGIFLVGITGGYPVGAQAVADSFARREIRLGDARRMMGFCNQAGPSFIFGITAMLFSPKAAPWALWMIGIVSAVITGALLPGKSHGYCVACTGSRNRGQSLERALTVMGKICGWVIVFRLLTAYLLGYIPFPQGLGLLGTGLLELTNGCLALGGAASEGVRFILCSFFLTFGGLCVGLQTMTVAGQPGPGQYFPGKVIQSGLSLILASCTVPVLFGDVTISILPPILVLGAVLVITGLCSAKIVQNNTSIPAPAVV